MQRDVNLFDYYIKLCDYCCPLQQIMRLNLSNGNGVLNQVYTDQHGRVAYTTHTSSSWREGTVTLVRGDGHAVAKVEPHTFGTSEIIINGRPIKAKDMFPKKSHFTEYVVSQIEVHEGLRVCRSRQFQGHNGTLYKLSVERSAKVRCDSAPAFPLYPSAHKAGDR